VAPPEQAEFDPKPILACLVRHEVEFVLIGGLAGMALGSTVLSHDVDIAYARDGTTRASGCGAARARRDPAAARR
jgi:hypothetical protein